MNWLAAQELMLWSSPRLYLAHLPSRLSTCCSRICITALMLFMYSTRLLMSWVKVIICPWRSIRHSAGDSSALYMSETVLLIVLMRLFRWRLLRKRDKKVEAKNGNKGTQRANEKALYELCIELYAPCGDRMLTLCFRWQGMIRVIQRHGYSDGIVWYMCCNGSKAANLVAIILNNYHTYDGLYNILSWTLSPC